MALIPCFALTAVLGLLSDGVHHDDDLTHFLMGRWAHWYPGYLLHIWGKPGLTIPLAAVAWIGDTDIGWHAARLLSAVVTAVTALLAARLAARLGVARPWLVVPALYIQPLCSLLAFTTLTETFTAFYLVAAICLLYARRPVVASLVFSLVLVTRLEALVLLPVWWLGLFGSRVSPARLGMAGLTAFWAPLAHNLAFRLVFQRWPITVFFAPHGSTEYPGVGWLGYILPALHAIPPVVAGCALIGGFVLLRRGRGLVPALAGTFFLTHVVIKALGVFASGGYGRFMVAISPLIAILVVVGLSEFAPRRGARRAPSRPWFVLGAVWAVGLLAFEMQCRAGRFAVPDERILWAIRILAAAIITLILLNGAAARGRPRARLARLTVFILAATCVVQWAVVARPLQPGDRQIAAHRVIQWLVDRDLADEPLFAASPWFAYYLNLVENPRAHKDATLLSSMPVGTIFIWDSNYSGNDFHKLELEAFQRDDHYRLLASFPASGANPVEMHVFHKIAETPLPTQPPESYPIDLMSSERTITGVYYIRAGDAEQQQGY